MTRDNIIEKYLQDIAEGQSDLVLDLLPHLSETMLYTPVIRFTPPDDEKGLYRIRVASYSSDYKVYVPTFTSEEYFLEWSQGKHKCFSVIGGDLALSLPPNTWLALNLGRENSLELSPGQILILSQVEPKTFERNRIVDNTQTQREDLFIDSFDPKAFESVDQDDSHRHPTVLFDADQFRRHFDDINESGDSSAAVYDIEGLTAALYEVCSDYPEIEASFFRETQDGQSFAVLGLLATSLSAERRFVLVDQVAEISRWYLGTAGAIELYDDLNLDFSPTWDFFRTSSPFYVRRSSAAN